MKRSARKDERRYVEELTKEAETAAGQRNVKKLYDTTRTLSGKDSNPRRPVKDKNGNLLSSEGDQRARWAEHFKEILNRPAPQTPPTIPTPTELQTPTFHLGLRSPEPSNPLRQARQRVPTEYLLKHSKLILRHRLRWLTHF